MLFITNLQHRLWSSDLSFLAGYVVCRLFSLPTKNTLLNNNLHHNNNDNDNNDDDHNNNNNNGTIDMDGGSAKTSKPTTTTATSYRNTNGHDVGSSGTNSGTGHIGYDREASPL